MSQYRLKSGEYPVHGALDYHELAHLHIEPDDVLDFSVNSNPYGPSPLVRDAIARIAIERYPDRRCGQLRQAICEYDLAGMRIEPDALLCGNGSSELIWTIARTFLSSGEKTGIIGPTFGEYATAAQRIGASMIEQRTLSTNSFQHDLSTLIVWLQQERPRLVWLCNPNNPTGTLFERVQLLALIEVCALNNIMLVIDESYYRFVHSSERFSVIEIMASEPELAQSVLVLRSLTKDYALAGVRLGYVVGEPSLIQQLQMQLPSWNVSSVAQAAGCAALADRRHLETSLAQLDIERAAFFSTLQQAGFSLIPTHTHFCLIEVGNASLVRQQLLRKMMLVRDCTSFGLPRYIRVATRSRHEWVQLVVAMQDVV